MRNKLVGTVVAVGLGLGLVGSAWATMPIMKEAKKAGFPATKCLYCHGEALPKKDKATFNDRGKWLIAEKEKRQAKEVDAAWLKDYTEPKAE